MSLTFPFGLAGDQGSLSKRRGQELEGHELGNDMDLIGPPRANGGRLLLEGLRKGCEHRTRGKQDTTRAGNRPS